MRSFCATLYNVKRENIREKTNWEGKEKENRKVEKRGEK
jgi:hypothetical protein